VNSSTEDSGAPRILVRGAGVAGLTVAYALVRRGASVTVLDKAPVLGGNASWLAGGMLAPWCERESAEEPVVQLGKGAADWWEEALPGHVVRAGTLVVAQPRDRSELDRFAARTSSSAWAAEDDIGTLEPDLKGRFRRGLFFSREAHLDPRKAMMALHARLSDLGVTFHFGADPDATPTGNYQSEVDCTGMSSPVPGLRGVRGEMLILRTQEVSLSRTVRMLHPRIPVYVVPRDDHHFMVGATMIENDSDGPVTVRSMMELLNAAYALHPAFGEAQIVEMGAGVRPAWPDNLPRVIREDRKIIINGFYRHGFLLAPAMAEEAADLAFGSLRGAARERENT
jgi:glycine oxidase